MLGNNNHRQGHTSLDVNVARFIPQHGKVPLNNYINSTFDKCYEYHAHIRRDSEAYSILPGLSHLVRGDVTSELLTYEGQRSYHSKTLDLSYFLLVFQYEFAYFKR